jgi:hypothetical protein
MRLNGEVLARAVFAGALCGDTTVNTARDASGRTLFSVATPIMQAGQLWVSLP